MIFRTISCLKKLIKIFLIILIFILLNCLGEGEELNTRILIEITLTDTMTEYYSTEDREFPKTGATKFYEGRLLPDIGAIEASLSDMYFGAKTISDFSFSCDNTDDYFFDLRDSYELRGTEVLVKRVDIDSDQVLESYYFTTNQVVLDLEKAVWNVIREELDIWKMTIPRKRITTDDFPDADESALGAPINTWFGYCTEIPTYCIQEDTDNDYYDFLIGWGIISSVRRVSREEKGSKEELDSYDNGVTTSQASFKLIDSTATFITNGIKAHMVVINVNNNTNSLVVSVDSETQLTLEDDIFITDQIYKIMLEFLFYDGSQSSPFAGYAFIRFLTEQRDVNGNLDIITITDLWGIKINSIFEKNPVKCFREWLVNTIWGLGLSVNESSFTAAASLCTDLYCSGGFWEYKNASEWRDIFLLQCKLAQLNKGSGGSEIYIPEYKSTDAATFDEHNMIEIVSDSKRQVTEYCKEVIVHYQYRVDYGKYSKEVSKSTDKNFGIIKEYYCPFLPILSDATIIASLIKNRFLYQDRQIVFTTGQDAASLKLHEIIKITNESLGLSDARYEIINISKRADDYELTVAEYSSAIFGES